MKRLILIDEFVVLLERQADLLIDDDDLRERCYAAIVEALREALPSAHVARDKKITNTISVSIAKPRGVRVR